MTMSRSWKDHDETCRHILKNLATVELIGRVGITEAARLLNISPTAIRSRIDPLERMVGGPIVEAKRNGGLTPLGKALRKWWEPIRNIIDGIADEIERLHDQRTLRLAVSRLTWEAEGERIESEYARIMPDVAIQAVYEDGCLAIENQVRDGVVDIGIVSALAENEYLEAPVTRHFWREDFMVMVAAPDSATRIADRVQIRPADFEYLHCRFLTMPEHNRMHGVVKEYMKKHRIDKFFRHKVALSDIVSIIDRVKKGDGVSILPEPAVMQAARDGGLETFLLHPPLMCRLDCLYRKGGLKSRLVHKFLECLEECDEGRKRRARVG
jgi:DNA-binding transcriptional LysR family regulator